MQGGLNLLKSNNVIHYVNELKKKNHLISLLDAGKVSDKNPTSIFDKNED